MRKKISPPLSLYKKIAIFFIVVSFLLVAGVLYFSLTYAFVDVQPTKSIVSRPFSFIVQSDSGKKDIGRGVFVGTVATESVTLEGQYAATGKVERQTGVTGTMKIINTSSASQGLIATTRFLAADGALFRLKNDVNAPANGSVLAEVYLDKDAKAAVVAAGARFTIPGLNAVKQTLIYGEAADDFTGEVTTVTTVSADDVTAAKADLVAQAQSRVAPKSAGTLHVIGTTIESETVLPLAGTEAAAFTVKAVIAVQAVSVEESSVTEYARKLLEAAITDDQELVTVMTDDLKLTVTRIEPLQQIAQLDGEISGYASVREGARVLAKSKLTGLTADEAKAYLENLEEVEKADITFFPFWVKKIPQFEDHIIIRINE